MTLTEVLSSPAWNVVSFPASADALQHIETQPYSALLVDALPGYEALIHHFRQRNPHSPIVLFTGGIEADAEERAEDAGANLILLKPLAVSLLRQHLQELISVATQKAVAITVFDVDLRDVMETEKRVISANVNGDIRMLKDLLSEEYLFAFGGMRETKQDRLDALRSGRLRYTKVEALRVEGKHYGDLCIVTGLLLIEGERDGRDISGVYHSLRIYGRKQGKWKAVAGQISRESQQALGA